MDVNPSRITEARQARGLNISQLAQKVDLSRQTISFYELGKRIPNTTYLSKIADALVFPIDFFYKTSPLEDISAGAIFYRSMKSAETLARKAAEVKCQWAAEAYLFISSYLNLPVYQQISSDFLLGFASEIDEELIEQLAGYVRAQWGLGNGPISHMTAILEKNGFVISGGSVDTGTIDACSTWINGIPMIFLGNKSTSIGSSYRQNFTLAHELGHLLMHTHITKEDLESCKAIRERTEYEANRFASSFLMPAESFLKDIYATSISYFLGIKRKWNVAVTAMIHRCKDLNILSDSEYLNLQKQISFRKWRKEEPYDKDTPLQHPMLFSKAFSMLMKYGIQSSYDILNHFKWPERDLREVCFLPADFFHESKDSLPNIISLK